MNNFYKVTEKDFIDGEFGEKLLDYNGYQIQISYNDDIQRWGEAIFGSSSAGWNL